MKLVRHRFQAMGGPCELSFYSEHKDNQREIIRHSVAEVKRLEKKYSRYLRNSIADQINQAARHTRLSKRVYHCNDEETNLLLDYAALAYDKSDALFDISSGVYRRIWDFKNQRIPSVSQIQDIKKLVGWDKIIWNNGKLRFPVQDMQVDFGGYVKEYAADRVADFLRRHAIIACIDLCGDLVVSAPHPDGSPWKIGISNPFDPNRAIARIDVAHGAIASSGDYQRCITIDGQRYSHIVNPKTGWPVQKWSAVSVFAEQCMVAGTASTVAMLKELHAAQWLRELELPAVLIDNKGNLEILNDTDDVINSSSNSTPSHFQNYTAAQITI